MDHNNKYDAVLQSDISDHFPICSFFNNPTLKNSNNDKPLLSHNFSRKNITKLNNYMSTHDWSHIIENENTDTSFSAFVEEFHNALLTFGPLSSMKATRFKQTWMSAGLLTSCKLKHKLHK